MSTTPSPTHSEFSEDSLRLRRLVATVEAPTIPPADLENDTRPNGWSSLGKRALPALVCFLIIYCIGVSATLVWQSYRDPPREMIASSYPQLSRSAPQAEPVAQNAPNVIALASPTAASPDQQQFNAILLALDGVRQSIDQIATGIASSMASSADRIATSIASNQEQIARSIDRIAASQEQIARSVDQLAADQEQMTREITKLQEIERSIRSKNSEPSPRPAPASAPKPASRPAAAPSPKPVSRAPPEPTSP